MNAVEGAGLLDVVDLLASKLYAGVWVVQLVDDLLWNPDVRYLGIDALSHPLA